MTIIRTVLAVAATSVLLAGCGSDETTAASEPAASKAESPTPTPTRSTRPPSPPPTPLPDAEDGTDLDACADGECEVRVSTGDRIAVDDASGVERVTVTVDPEIVTFEVELTAGGFTTHAAPDYPSSAINGIQFLVHGINGAKAVVAMTAAP